MQIYPENSVELVLFFSGGTFFNPGIFSSKIISSFPNSGNPIILPLTPDNSESNNIIPGYVGPAAPIILFNQSKNIQFFVNFFQMRIRLTNIEAQDEVKEALKRIR